MQLPQWLEANSLRETGREQAPQGMFLPAAGNIRTRQRIPPGARRAIAALAGPGLAGFFDEQPDNRERAIRDSMIELTIEVNGVGGS
jgi:hypothetical protein